MWVRGLKQLFYFDEIGVKESHPVWVRGLKQLIDSIFRGVYIVAPRVGAWIETLINVNTSDGVESHPVWVRGLKRIGSAGCCWD